VVGVHAHHCLYTCMSSCTYSPEPTLELCMRYGPVYQISYADSTMQDMGHLHHMHVHTPLPSLGLQPSVRLMARRWMGPALHVTVERSSTILLWVLWPYRGQWDCACTCTSHRIPRLSLDRRIESQEIMGTVFSTWVLTISGTGHLSTIPLWAVR
jgi:hypothetical protein